VLYVKRTFIRLPVAIHHKRLTMDERFAVVAVAAGDRENCSGRRVACGLVLARLLSLPAVAGGEFRSCSLVRPYLRVQNF
jgi:hypothetical protein